VRSGLGRKVFFSEEKKQQTFDWWRAPRRQRAQTGNGFLVFFKKRARFLHAALSGG
jgi:cell wall-associated NlpC family hydrolase